jgi:hypothetical protein
MVSINLTENDGGSHCCMGEQDMMAVDGDEDRAVDEEEEEDAPCSAVAAVMAHVLSWASLEQRLPMLQLGQMQQQSQAPLIPPLSDFLAKAWRASSKRHHCELEPPPMDELAALMVRPSTIGCACGGIV